MVKKFLFLILMLAALLGLAAGNGCNSESGSQQISSDKSFTVETDYANLKLPYKYSDAITAKVDSNTVTLSSGKTVLLEFYFNSDKGIEIGTFKSKNGEEKISVQSYDVKKNKNYTAMQDECINSIIEGLTETNNFTPSTKE